MVSVIIPSRNEVFLNQTIQDVLNNATGEIEVFPVIDGYERPVVRVSDSRVKYICLPDNGHMQKRQGINTAVSIARGKYVMALDAHCMVAKGFDEALTKDCEDNWIVVPRRYKLEPISWTIRQDFPHADYEYWMWNELRDNKILKNHAWHNNRPEKESLLIDDVLTLQGSCWFMHKSYFQRMGFMQVEGYTGWGAEGEELALKTWTTGGRVVVNKKTWYAHLFKGRTYGRMYHCPQSQYVATRRYAYNYWVINNRDKFVKVINKFMPIPNYPVNWERYIYG